MDRDESGRLNRSSIGLGGQGRRSIIWVLLLDGVRSFRRSIIWVLLLDGVRSFRRGKTLSYKRLCIQNLLVQHVGLQRALLLVSLCVNEFKDLLQRGRQDVDGLGQNLRRFDSIEEEIL